MMTSTDFNKVANEMRDSRAADLAWKAWHRALNASRREVAKTMEKLGYRISIWTKRDKGRTIMQVQGNGAAFQSEMARVIASVNQKWATRLTHANGTWTVKLSPDACGAAGDWWTIMLGTPSENKKANTR
jgi:hypothetical protein